MATTVAYKGLLAVSTDQPIAGRNYPDNRSVWHPVADIVRGGDTGTVWWTDNGPKGTDSLTVEPRTFCYKGVATINFTGRNLAVRINVAYGWFGDAQVTIDGVAPSTLGLSTFKDVLSANAADYPAAVELQRYIDVVVADGLTNAAHVCVISVNADLDVADIDTNKFFSMAGYRVGAGATQTLAKTGAWICPLSEGVSHNKTTLKFKNDSAAIIYDITVAFPAALVDADGAAVADITVAELKPGHWFTQVVQPNYIGNEHSTDDTHPPTAYGITVTASYVDPAGAIGPNISTIQTGLDASLTTETSTPSSIKLYNSWFYFGHTWNATELAGVSVQFYVVGDAMTVHTASGGGRSDYEVWSLDPSITPYMQEPAYSTLGADEIAPWRAAEQAGVLALLAASGTLVATVNNDDVNPNQYAVVSGLGAGRHLIYVVMAESKAFVWEDVSTSSLYAELVETVTLTYDAKQPIALPVENIVVNDDGVTFDQPVIGAVEFGPTKQAVTWANSYSVPPYLYSSVFETAEPHGFVRNDVIWMAGADQDYWNGSQVVTIIDDTHFQLHPRSGSIQNAGNGSHPDAVGTREDPTPIPGITVQKDYTTFSIRKNTDLVYTEILSRFPTFAVCYQSGFRDILVQYDALIIDPIGAAARDVLYWQSKGIEVYGYIASGEEFGFYSERYNFGSALAPNAGDGLGPGGYAGYYMYTRYGTTGAGWEGTWSLPDKNGVWASFYTNPDPAFGWPQRVDDYYAPLVLGGPANYVDEGLILLDNPSAPEGRVTNVAHAPIDPDELLYISYGGAQLLPYSHFTFDAKTGAIVFALSQGLGAAPTNVELALDAIMNRPLGILNGSPPFGGGPTVFATYTRKGHHCEGVFWDVVDTPDVYLSHTFEFGYAFVPGYDTQFITFLNNFKINHPTAKMISNRGFTILPQIIASCAGVMFESWLTHPTDIEHLFTTDYAIIDDPAAIAYNEAVNVELRELRAHNVYDCYSLNYCLPGEPGAELREYCATQDRIRGYLSWTSTITLDVPAPNEPVVTVGAPTSPAIPTGPANEFVRVDTVPVFG